MKIPPFSSKSRSLFAVLLQIIVSFPADKVNGGACTFHRQILHTKREKQGKNKQNRNIWKRVIFVERGRRKW